MGAARFWHTALGPSPKRRALGFYHEKKDEQRDVGLGPEHDWSSHAADAFGLMAIAYEEPSRLARFNRKIEYPQLGIV
jgi:phage terminase large subunit